MRMKRQSKYIIGIIEVLLVTLLLNTNVYAAGKQCDRTSADQRYNVKRENDTANSTIKVSIDNGAFDVIITTLDPTYVPQDGQPDEKVLKEERTTLNANSKNGAINKVLNYKYDKTQRQIIKITLVFTDTNDSLCTPDNGLQYEMKFTIPGQTSSQYKDNTHYNGLCANLRNGVWSDKLKNYVSRELFEKYNPAVTNSASTYANSLATYCYSARVLNNYSEDTVAMLIGNAIKAYKNSFKTSINVPSAPSDIPKENQFDLSSSTSADSSRFNQGLKLTCDSKNLGTIGKFEYVNKHVYYAHNESTTSETLSSGKQITCQKACSETLTVEYGPPVASKAGLCFEYKVRVVSEVKCDSTVTGEPPTPTEYPVCEPIPVCNELTGREHQAGPSDEFDSCIQTCDSGKYTQNCINKCYDKVYKNTTSTNLSNTFYASSVLKLASKISSTCDYTNSGGHYAWEGNELVWKGGTGCTAYSPYYFKYEGARTAYDHNRGAYYPDSKGFKHNSKGCNDNCRYEGCTKDDLLTEEEADSKYREDLNTYQDFVSSCNAQASCSTKTAEFTIKVNNKTTDEPNKDNWINFDTATITNKNIQDASNIILDRSGCYGDGNAENSYLTEWSFPGTWINNKTGEISYKPISDKTWHKKKNYFCTNLKSKDVNTSWWYYGMTGDEKYYPSTAELQKLEYNIKATAKNFGHYSWNVDISCFYALNETSNKRYDPDPGCDCADPECYKNNDVCKTPKTTSTMSYKIRTVDNKDLFPSTEGNATTSSTDTGRTPGFNWTAEATNTKNKDYIIAPSILREQIQDKQDKIYANDTDSSNELDYRFYLDKATLNKIRNYTKTKANGKYTTFNGTFEVINGVSVYKSNLFRGTGSEIDSKYIKKLGLLGCNNQANSDKCDNYAQAIGG